MVAPSRRPAPVTVLAAAVALEAIGLGLLAVGFLISIFGRHVIPLGGLIFATVVLGLGATWLAAAARDSFRGKRWPRAAILVSQVFLIVVGISIFEMGLGVWGSAAVILALVTLVCLFQRSAVAWMSESQRYPAP